MQSIYLYVKFVDDNSLINNCYFAVPEGSAKIYVTRYNDTHINVECKALGARPKPTLMIYIEGIKVDDKFDDSLKIINEYSDDNLSVTRNAIIKNIMNPVLIECEISISETNYKRREKMVYYPDNTKN